MTQYNEIVMDHFRNPRKAGVLSDANAVGQVENPVCGDMTRIYLKIGQGVIQDARFQTQGCAAAIATSSVGTEMIVGMSVENARNITARAVAQEAGGLPRNKIHCSVLIADAIRSAIADYKKP